MKNINDQKMISLIEFIDKKADSIFHELAEKNADSGLVEQMGDLCNVVAKLAAVYEDSDILERIVETANQLDSSSDPGLQKAASLLDDILLMKTSLFSTASSDDELARLRSEYSTKQREHDYVDTKKKNNRDNDVEKVQKAFADQVAAKAYRPCETALSTRYDPDHAGVMLIRISDNVYQSSLTGKIYDFYNGYTTNKGNKVPGTSVDRQIPDWSFEQPVGFMFDSREGRMSRFASVKQSETEEDASVKKKAEIEDTSSIDSIRKHLSKDYDLTNVTDLDIGKWSVGTLKDLGSYVKVLNFLYKNQDNLSEEEVYQTLSNSGLADSDLQLLLKNFPTLNKEYKFPQKFPRNLSNLRPSFKESLRSFIAEPYDENFEKLYNQYKFLGYGEDILFEIINSVYNNINYYDIRIKQSQLERMFKAEKARKEEAEETAARKHFNEHGSFNDNDANNADDGEYHSVEEFLIALREFLTSSEFGSKRKFYIPKLINFIKDNDISESDLFKLIHQEFNKLEQESNDSIDVDSPQLNYTEAFEILMGQDEGNKDLVSDFLTEDSEKKK